jgi:hypothetical protein
MELIDNLNCFDPKKIALHVVDQNLITELLEHCFNQDASISSRSTWILWHCFVLDKKKVIPYFDKLIDNLKNEHLHNGVIRNTLRLFQKCAVPHKKESLMLDLCYKYVQDNRQAIAVRAFAMTVIYNISLPYPELLLELKGVLELTNHTQESSGIKSRIKKILYNIDKTILKKN